VPVNNILFIKMLYNYKNDDKNISETTLKNVLLTYGTLMKDMKNMKEEEILLVH